MHSYDTETQKSVLRNLEIAIRQDLGETGIPIAAVMIAKKQGSYSGCLSDLCGVHNLKANAAWFLKHDLSAFKQACFTKTKLEYIRWKDVGRFSIPSEAMYFFALFSDHEPSLQWLMAPHALAARTEKLVNHLNDAFFRYHQMTLAMRGDWPALAERAEHFLANVPAKMKKFAVDQRFYLALSRADRPGMVAAVEELISPKVAKVRNDVFELAFPSAFIASHATMYAKIAWRHGHELAFDTPLIPAEWLPVRPLTVYEDPYDFMKPCVIGQPLA